MVENQQFGGKRNFCSTLFSMRYLLATLGSIGMGIVYGLKVNFHVTIVSMVNHTALNSPLFLKADPKHILESSCFTETLDIGQNAAVVANEDGPFLWSGTLQGTLVSAYFWGYLIAQLPGGRIAEVYSAKWVMFSSVAINVICTVLTPLAARWHYGAVIAMRIGEGIGGGVTFPAMHVLLAHWAPPNERSTMSSMVYAGTALGTVVFMLVSGLLASSIGWSWVFYLEGAISGLWLILWAWFITDYPKDHPFIHQDEINHITSSLNLDEASSKKSKHVGSVPWKKVFTSAPFLAILVAHTCNNWGWYMVLTELPLYLKEVLNFPMSQNALLSAMPFLCMWIFSVFLSRILDTLKSKGSISTGTARKSATLIASLTPAVCFIGLSYVGCHRVLAVVLITLSVTSIGGMFSGFLSNHIDIAPNYAGTLVGITNTIATIPGIVVPVFVGHLTQQDPSITSWRIIFWTTVILFVIEAIIYSLFASGEEQSWNSGGDANLDVETQALNVQITSPATSETKSYHSTSTN